MRKLDLSILVLPEKKKKIFLELFKENILTFPWA